MGYLLKRLIFVLTQVVPKAVITKFAVLIAEVIVLIVVRALIILVLTVPVVIRLAIV